MNGVDQAELQAATLVTYALLRALLDERHAEGAKVLATRALEYLPPRPELEVSPSSLEMWNKAEKELRTLAGK